MEEVVEQLLPIGDEADVVRESALVGEEVLSREHESDFEVPHTVIIEARKPLS